MSGTGLLLQNAELEYALQADANLSLVTLFQGITKLYLSLHTFCPLDSGTQQSSEIGYTNYSRQPLTRDLNGWTVDGNNSVGYNKPLFGWPPCTGSTATARWVGIGTAQTGPGKLLYYAPIHASGMKWMEAHTNVKVGAGPPAAGVAANYITVASHNLGADPTFTNGDEVAVLATYEEALPILGTGTFSPVTPYFIANGTIEGTWPEGISFQLATVSGAGTVVDLTPGDSRCTTFSIIRITPLAISTGITPTLPASAGVIYGV